MHIASPELKVSVKTKVGLVCLKAGIDPLPHQTLFHQDKRFFIEQGMDLLLGFVRVLRY